MENISEHISWAEATRSQTAIRKGIDNAPTPEHLEALKYVANQCFEPIRKIHDKPIFISSAYRSPLLNIAIGGSENSQHCKGEALDMDADYFDNGITNKEIFFMIKNHLEFDQLIWEFGTKENPDWVHVSLKKEGNNRGEVLVAKRVDDRVRYEHFTESV